MGRAYRAGQGDAEVSLTIVKLDGEKATTQWPIEALLDLFAPLEADNYPTNILARMAEVERRYGLERSAGERDE